MNRTALLIAEFQACVIDLYGFINSPCVLKIVSGNVEVESDDAKTAFDRASRPVFLSNGPQKLTLSNNCRLIFLCFDVQSLRRAVTTLAIVDDFEYLISLASFRADIEPASRLDACLISILNWSVEDQRTLPQPACFKGSLNDVLIMRAAYVLAAARTGHGGGAPRAEHPALRVAVQYIDERYATQIRTHDLAELCGVSLRTLQLLFSKHMNCAISDYIRGVRLKNARSALLASGPADRVGAIAESCGFRHMGDFATLYRQTYGETPAATLSRARTGS